MPEKRRRGRPRKVNGSAQLIDSLRSGEYSTLSIVTVTVKDVVDRSGKPLRIGLKRFSPAELIGEVGEVFKKEGKTLEEQLRNVVEQIATAAYDPTTREPLFTTEQDREMLLGWPFSTLSDLVNQIAQQSMLSAQAVDEAKNESKQIQ